MGLSLDVTCSRSSRYLPWLLLMCMLTSCATSSQRDACQKIETRGGPEDLVLLETGSRQWLLTATTRRGLIRLNTAAYFELIELDHDGAPMPERQILFRLIDSGGHDMRPVGISVRKSDQAGVFDVHVINNRKASRLEHFSLAPETAVFTYLGGEWIGPKGEVASNANDVLVMDDGRAIVSNPRLFGRHNKAWVIRGSDGNWRYADVSMGFSNGVQMLGDRLVIADYLDKAMYLMNPTDFTLERPASRLKTHPDNIAIGERAGQLTVATHNNRFTTFLHLVLGRWLPAGWQVYRLERSGSGLVASKANHPVPRGAAAVSTAIETDQYWYFSQIKRHAIHACRKLP